MTVDEEMKLPLVAQPSIKNSKSHTELEYR